MIGDFTFNVKRRVFRSQVSKAMVIVDLTALAVNGKMDVLEPSLPLAGKASVNYLTPETRKSFTLPQPSTEPG